MGGEVEIIRDGFTIHEAFNSTSLDTQIVGPITHREYRRMEPSVEQLKKDLTEAKTQAGMNASDISSINTALVGINGKGGIFERLEGIEDSQKETQAMLQGIRSLIVEGLGNTERRVDKVEAAANAAMEKATSAENELAAHLAKHGDELEDEVAKEKARKWALRKSIVQLISGSGMTIIVALILYFAFGIG